MRRAGVVDQDVDASQLVDGLAHHASSIGFVPDIAEQRDRAATEPLDFPNDTSEALPAGIGLDGAFLQRVLRAACRDVGDRHVGPGLSQRPGNGAPQTVHARTSGDQRDPAV